MTIITKIDLTILSGSQLAAVYNAIVDVNMQVRKFADKAAAVKRVERKLTERGLVVVPTGIVQGECVAELDFGLIMVESTIPAAPAPAAKPSRAVFGEDELIRVNTVQDNANKKYANPKRAGTKSHARFQIIVDAVELTVKQYLDACVALEGPDAEDRFKYRRDIAWDIEHGFIMFPEAK